MRIMSWREGEGAGAAASRPRRQLCLSIFSTVLLAWFLAMTGNLFITAEALAQAAPYPSPPAPMSDSDLKRCFQGRVVAIDPGHGGEDPGVCAENNRVLEKDINLQIAKRLQGYLESLGAKVILTRDTDQDYFPPRGQRGKKTAKQVDLDHRLELVRQGGAQVFLSIHLNAIRQPSCRGAEAFFQRGNVEGQRLAQALQARLHQVPTMNRRVAKPADFYLLRNLDIPAVMLELGYLSNPQERYQLSSSRYQMHLVRAIAQGLCAYWQAPPPPASPAWLAPANLDQNAL